MLKQVFRQAVDIQSRVIVFHPNIVAEDGELQIRRLIVKREVMFFWSAFIFWSAFNCLRKSMLSVWVRVPFLTPSN